MSAPNHTGEPFRLTPSAIARYFYFDCDRFLRYWASLSLGIPPLRRSRVDLLGLQGASRALWGAPALGRYPGRLKAPGCASARPTRRKGHPSRARPRDSALPRRGQVGAAVTPAPGYHGGGA
jgi:hypothetical protein